MRKLISSSMSRHLSTRNISSKYTHAFLSNLAYRQTDRQTDKRGQMHVPPPLSEVNYKYKYLNLLFKYNSSTSKRYNKSAILTTFVPTNLSKSLSFELCTYYDGACLHHVYVVTGAVFSGPVESLFACLLSVIEISCQANRALRLD